MCGLLSWAFTAHAEQRAFSITQTADKRQYQYQWEDAQGQPQQLTFALSLEQIEPLPEEQATFQPVLAQRYVTVSLLKAAKAVDPRQAKILVKQRGDAVNVKIESPSNETATQLQSEFATLREQAFTTYLTERYFTRYTTPMLRQAIKPDHIRHIQESTLALLPLSQAIYEKLARQSDAREYMNFLLSWVQSIPYDAMDNRVSSNGAGFAPPIYLLNSNKGDCDSKSVLSAAVIRSFLPQVPMALILLRDHALLGVAISQRPDDKTLMIEGVPYVLLEPTGPALLPFGDIAESSLQKLQSGYYTIEPIPAR